MEKFSLFVMKVLAVALVIGSHSLTARAAWGDLDPSFGFGGYAIEGITGYKPRSVAVQPDGKILVTGYRVFNVKWGRFFLRRYLANGNIDTTFGTNGSATGPETNSIGTDYRGDAIVVLPEGRIAVSGWANGFNAVWQFTSRGIPDKTFGTDGLRVLENYPLKCSTTPGMNTGYPELNIHAGKLLLSLGKGTGGNCRVALVRLTASGALDSNFGNAGESLTSISGGYRGFGTALGPDGKITVAGVIFNNQGYKTLERKFGNGLPDPSLTPLVRGYGGQVLPPGLVRMMNGEYVNRWTDLNPDNFSILDVHSSSGIFESTITIFPEFEPATCPEIFTKQSDGKLVVQLAGNLFRLKADLDVLSIEEKACTNFTDITDFGRAALQPDHKIVAAGLFNGKLILARMMP